MKGKGGKSRVVPIGQYACHYIAEYLRKGRKYFLRGRTDDPGLLFLSGWGNPFNASTINRSVMWKIAAEAGLKKDLTCYTLRHSVATHLLRADANVMYIATPRRGSLTGNINSGTRIQWIMKSSCFSQRRTSYGSSSRDFRLRQEGSPDQSQ